MKIGSMRDYRFSHLLAEFHCADANISLVLNFGSSKSCLIVTVSCSKRPRLGESDLEDSDSPFEMTEETAGGLESGKESEFDRLLENESDISW